MTIQEAIKTIKELHWTMTGQQLTALDMAIEALNFVSEYHQSNIEAYAHDMGVSLEQAERELRVDELSCSEKPNRSDLISRQNAINKFEPWLKVEGYSEGELNMLKAILYELTVMPSAQPEHTSNNDCNGCKFVGCYDTGFPCANCIRKNKDYYAPERRTDETD